MNYQVSVKTNGKVDESHIIKVASEHLFSRKAKSGIFEIELIAKQKMREINKKFRNIDMPTDVLSFPSASIPGKDRLYGTIFLSCDIINKNAKESGKSFLEEFDFILKHGLDHLIGIHHK